MSGHSPEEIKKHVKIYMLVFFALACLTIITVAVSYLNVTFAAGLAIALAVASVKGYLVASHFMHLKTEKKIIFAILILTVLLVAVLFLLPLLTNGNKLVHPYVS